MTNRTKHKDLGLLNTKEVFHKAMAGEYAMTAVIRKIVSESPSEFDPRKYLGPARDELIAMIKGKNINVLGSANRV